MKKIIPSVLFKEQPFLNFFSRSKYLSVVLDRKGRMVFACKRENHPRQVLINQMMGKRIGEFFKIPGDRDLQGLLKAYPEETTRLDRLTWDSVDRLGWEQLPFYPSTPRMDQFVVPSAIHTRLSQANLNLFRINIDFFLGVISFYELDPLVSGITSDIVCVTDMEGRLLAYNQALADALGLKEPCALLDQPLESVAGFSHGEDRGGAAGPARFRGVEVETRWSAGLSDGLQYFHFPETMDHDACDYRVEFLARAVKGGNGLPCLLLRAERRDPADVAGYLFGPRADGRHFVFKKKGIELCRIPFPGLEKMREAAFSAEKTGNVFRFYVNREPVFTYAERFPFAPSPGKHPAIMARPGTACVVSGISARMSPPCAPAEALVFATLLRRPGERYRVRQEPGMFHRCGPVLMYRFENIATFDREIARLSREKEAVAREKTRIEKALKTRHTLGGFIGENSRVQAIRENLSVLAVSATHVLLTGETGTGKEELARLFHELSPRAGKPFVKLDCSTLPATLIESELFGYEPGAFTGAARAHAGRFEQANGGTLFLDEISNLSPDTQAKLLGVMEDLRITRLGGTRPVPLSLSIISATNQDLEGMIGKSLFRSDLFYRLSRFKIAIPPLRERMDDVPLLCRHFLDLANKEYGKTAASVSEEAYQKMYSYPWPGNVRELKNAVFKAVLFSKNPVIGPSDLDFPTLPDRGARSAEKTAFSGKVRPTEMTLANALRESGGNVSAAASALGVTRPTVYNYLRRFQKRPADFRGEGNRR